MHHKHLHHTLPPHMTHPVKVSNCCATAGTKDACDCWHKKSKHTVANSVGFYMGFFVFFNCFCFKVQVFKNKYQSKPHILHLHPLQLCLNLEMTYLYMGKGGSKWVPNNWHLKTKTKNKIKIRIEVVCCAALFGKIIAILMEKRNQPDY